MLNNLRIVSTVDLLNKRKSQKQRIKWWFISSGRILSELLGFPYLCVRQNDISVFLVDRKFLRIRSFDKKSLVHRLHNKVKMKNINVNVQVYYLATYLNVIASLHKQYRYRHIFLSYCKLRCQYILIQVLGWLLAELLPFDIKRTVYPDPLLNQACYKFLIF